MDISEEHGTLDISPAYGRLYSTPEAAEKDWIAGKDFRIMLDGPYLSIRDSERLKADGYRFVMIWTALRAGVEVKL